MSSQTPILGLNLQGTGDNPLTWGERFNADTIFQLGQALTGTLTVLNNEVLDPESSRGVQSRRVASLRADATNPGSNVTAVIPTRSHRRFYGVLNTRAPQTPNTPRFNLRGPAGVGLSLPNGISVLAFYDPETDDVREIGLGTTYATENGTPGVGSGVQFNQPGLGVTQFTRWRRQGKQVVIPFRDFGGTFPDEEFNFIPVNPLPAEMVPSATRSVPITYRLGAVETTIACRLIIPTSPTDPWLIERLDGVPHNVGFRSLKPTLITYLL